MGFARGSSRSVLLTFFQSYIEHNLRKNNGPYIQSRDYTSALKSFMENLVFFPLSIYSSTPKANKGFLGPPNTDRGPRKQKEMRKRYMKCERNVGGGGGGGNLCPSVLETNKHH
jgi:hypothetical protein